MVFEDSIVKYELLAYSLVDMYVFVAVSLVSLQFLL